MSEKLLNEGGASLWDTAKASIASAMSPEIFASWFEPMSCLSGADGTLTLEASSDFAADWIRNNYSDVIKKHLYMAVGENVDFKIVGARTPAEADSGTLRGRLPSESAGNSRRQKVEPPVIGARNTFENFVVGEGNSLAHAASLAVAKSPGSAFNPLCLYGSTGLGKTHLMHAVAHFIFNNNPESRIVYISSERFVNEFIRAIQDNDLVKFRQKYRSVDVLMIDDVQFFSGKARCQDEFFHTFNELFHSGKQIILSSDRPVAEIPDLNERLVTRFEWGMPIDIQPPDYETRVAILHKKAEALNASIAPEIVDLLARRITKNVRRMEGALNKLVAYTLLLKGPHTLDLPTAEKLLADSFLQEEGEAQVDVAQIQQKTAEFYNISVSDIVGPRRPANIALARQVAMYLSRKLTKHSLQEIGGLFGGRNHGTVMHAIAAVSTSMEQDEKFARDIEFLTRRLSV